MMWHLPLLIVLVMALAGCLPYPHAQHDYPEISGELVGPSGPLKGVRIALLHNAETESCENPEQVVLTTHDGTFKFAPKREFQLAMVFGDRLDQWSLCIVTASGSVVSWRDQGYWGAQENRISAAISRKPQGYLSVRCLISRKIFREKILSSL